MSVRRPAFVTLVAALAGSLGLAALAEQPAFSPVPQSRAAALAAGAAKVPVQAVTPDAPGGNQPLLTVSAARGGKTAGGKTPVYQPWMSPEVADAWNAGYRGQGTTITVVDDFSSTKVYSGNLGTGTSTLRHGEWTRLEASMIAPSAAVASHDFASGRSVGLARSGLNAVNLSYGMYARSGYSIGQIGWSAQESSLIGYATDGRAVVVKAAGNDAVAVGTANRAGNTDYLNVALAGAQSAIFVGALDRNGTVASPALLASYSNFAGSDPVIQAQFLAVGVRGDLTGLYGTSFAAPVVTGYAAVLGSKFTTATPTQITNRLLDTARTDTIGNYSAAVHGRGEASIARALAPASIY